MSPRRVRRTYIRHLIVWGALTVPLIIVGVIWPMLGWILLGFFGVVAVLGLLLLGIPCLVLAVARFLSTGYWTNPFRHGPWGDWKGEL